MLEQRRLVFRFISLMRHLRIQMHILKLIITKKAAFRKFSHHIKLKGSLLTPSGENGDDAKSSTKLFPLTENPAFKLFIK